MIRSLLLVALAAATLGAAACSEAERGTTEGDRLRVVATTPLLGELAGRVAGEDAAVSSLIPRGVDLHSWQPSPEVARDVAQADVVIVNGYNLEEGLLGIVEANVRDGVPVVVAAAGLTALEGGDHDEEHADEAPADGASAMRAEGDPHLWLAVPNAIRYVENIRGALAGADATHAEGYEGRAGELIAELEALDDEVRAELAAIPEARRTIVVFHDAYRYLAAEYGFEVSASVASANPNQATSAQAIAQIVDRVRELDVTAVFKEPQFSAQALDLIAEETGTRVLPLYSTLSDEVPTYADLMRANAASLVEGLTP